MTAASPPRDAAPRAIRANLHVHSTFSDGLLSPDEILRAGAAAGLSVVGFADHFRSAKLGPDRSLTADRIEAYSRALRSAASGQTPGPAVLVGLEIAFVLLGTDLTSLGLLDRESAVTRHIDYALFEYVSDPIWGGLELIELVKIRPALRIPVGLAHCDIDRVFRRILPPVELARVLAGNEIFVELCPSERNSRPGPMANMPDRVWLPYYRVDSEYLKEFFKFSRRVGVRFSIGTDLHDDADGIGDLDDAAAFLEENGLAGNLVKIEPRVVQPPAAAPSARGDEAPEEHQGGGSRQARGHAHGEPRGESGDVADRGKDPS